MKTKVKTPGARAVKPIIPPYIPADNDLEIAAKQQKLEAKAQELLGYNPWLIVPQLEKWQKAVQWHGMPDLRKKLRKAGFNLPMLLAHLEAMITRLKSDH